MKIVFVDVSFSSEKQIKKNYGDMAKKIMRLIDDLELAKNLEELQKKRNHLEELKGNRKGMFKLTITGNYRLIF